MTDRPGHVIVGGGLAGAQAAVALRERGFDGSISLIGAESHLPYERPPLSKSYLLGDSTAESAQVRPAGWYAEQQIDLRSSTTVTAVDRAAKVVRTDAGATVPYDKLLLATGSSPRRLAVPGATLAGVHYLRTLADSDRLRQVFVSGARVVVVGGGWIGLETASAARAAGAEVTVLEQAALPLLPVLGPRIAGVFAGLHRDHGVDLRTEVQVTEIRGGATGAVSAVVLGDGTEIPADAVVVGIGAAPNIDLARGCGLDTDNGVLADEQLRTSDRDIFAVGDIANAQHPLLGGRLRVEHWANALHQPAVAAAAMTGGAETYDRLPYFFTDQYDLGMEYVGHADPATTDVVVRGDLDRREFIAFWVRDRRVLAGMNVNVWDVTDEIEQLVRARTVVDLDRLADAAVPLTAVGG